MFNTCIIINLLLFLTVDSLGCNTIVKESKNIEDKQKEEKPIILSVIVGEEFDHVCFESARQPITEQWRQTANYDTQFDIINAPKLNESLYLTVRLKWEAFDDNTMVSCRSSDGKENTTNVQVTKSGAPTASATHDYVANSTITIDCKGHILSLLHIDGNNTVMKVITTTDVGIINKEVNLTASDNNTRLLCVNLDCGFSYTTKARLCKRTIVKDIYLRLCEHYDINDEGVGVSTALLVVAGVMITLTAGLVCWIIVRKRCMSNNSPVNSPHQIHYAELDLGRARGARWSAARQGVGAGGEREGECVYAEVAGVLQPLEPTYTNT